MKRLLFFALLCIGIAFGQAPTRWFATTGNVSLSAAATAATIQQPANGATNVSFEMIVVYCSVACPVTLIANGTGATSTAGTVQSLLPSNLGLVAPFTFWTASNTSGGTQQGGVIQVPGGIPYTICLNTSCGMPATTFLQGAGTNVNYTASIGAITGTANVTFFVETR